MDHQEWLLQRAHLMIEELPQSSKDILRTFHAIVDYPEIAQATVHTFVCMLYVDCHSLDSIAKHLHEAGFFSPTLGADAIRSGLVSPICDNCRQTQVRFDNWWDVPGLFDQFHSFYITQRLREIGREAMSKELRTHWMLKNPELIEQLLERAQKTSSDDIWSVFKESVHTPAGQMLESIRSDPEIEALVDQYIQTLPDSIHQRNDLVAFSRFFKTLAVAKECAKDIEHEIRDEFFELCTQLYDSAVSYIRNLSECEMRLLVPKDPNRILLEEFVRANVGIYHVWQEFPEVVESKDFIPGWIYDYVFARGGRLHHLAAGPILNFLVVLEPTNPAPEQRIGFLPVEQQGDLLDLELLNLDSRGKTVFPFSYQLSDTESLRELALLCLCGQARLNFLRIQQPAGLEIVSIHKIRFPPEWLLKLQALVVPLIQSRFAASKKEQYKEVYRESFYSQISGGEGFLMYENAKSERLLEDLGDFIDDEDTTGLRDQYRGIRSRLLDAYSARARLLLGGQEELENELKPFILSLENELTHARQDLRSVSKRTSKPDDSMTRLQSFANTLGSDKRCIVHIGFESGYFSAFWLRNNNGEMTTGYIDLSRLSVKDVHDGFRKWSLATDFVQRQDALMKVLDSLSDEFAARIVDALSPLGVRNLVLCPVWMLDALPLHCITVGSSEDLLLDCFDTVTYAPSASVLERLVQLGQIVIHDGLAMSYSAPGKELPLANIELELVQSMLPRIERRSGMSATATSLLGNDKHAGIYHVAAHGYWLPGDYSSGLELASTPATPGFVSIADILTKGDFRQTGLVTLSTCESGLSLRSPYSVQEYIGVDGAFLARGARSTVSTLWEISDLVAYLFMYEFYRILAQGCFVEEAYTGAVNFLREKKYINADWAEIGGKLPIAVMDDIDEVVNQGRFDLSDPFFWGSFKCSGWVWGGTRVQRC